MKAFSLFDCVECPLPYHMNMNHVGVASVSPASSLIRKGTETVTGYLVFHDALVKTSMREFHGMMSGWVEFHQDMSLPGC
jgi:hypothetical protein